MENDERQERRTEPENERDTMKNSRKTNVKSNTSDIEAKEKKEQQEQEKILAAKYLIELIRSVLEERKPQKAGKNFGTVRRQRKFVKKFAAVTVIVG